MGATRLIPRRVAKPWGRDDIGPLFDAGGERIGEIWFELPAGQAEPALLVKYLFTSEALSVQVHPDDAQARAAGARQGKEEAWLILDAADDAVIGLGLEQRVAPERLRDAALDGSIESLIDWKPVAPGDHFHVVPGTIHAIGGGLSLIEVQQYADITYRLYDYGRPRELHLDEAMTCAEAGPYRAVNQRTPVAAGIDRLVDGPKFALIDVQSDDFSALPDLGAYGPIWFVPVEGDGGIASAAWQPGECWLLDDAVDLAVLSGRGRALIAWATP
ncbi:MAG TPA: class I mannose-6-phosphate isomerase [Sphingopyxis sp.]|nr:class I mannose-6-phosphate isomerase [Sphingopyxis sp.]HMP45691.1 class I mannose-6-phosphate isomerase [Sphingopyxis sp.]HMQ18258.1 class I mannose-6-phosphate isomerase [Sphingopyxis sp.]